jgi:hypothetical protein
VATHTDSHRGHIGRGKCFGGGNGAVAKSAIDSIVQVSLMTEGYRPFRVRKAAGIIRISMTHPAVFVVVNIMTFRAEIHIREIFVR